ncbi:OmpA family protein, partial [Hyphomonas polymorpha PS728]
MCATAAAAFATAGATAHAEDGWYSRADIQYSFDGTVDHDPTAAFNGSMVGDSSVSENLGLSVGLGYGFANGLRLEGVLGQRGGDLDVPNGINGTLTGATAAPAGYASVTDLMVNGLYDFNKGGSIQPYIGLGVGGARVDAKASNRTFAAGAAANGFSDKASGIAYQGLLGVGFKLSERLTMDVGYKYFTVEDLNFDGKAGTAGSYDVDYQDHTATLGVRYSF